MKYSKRPAAGGNRSAKPAHAQTELAHEVVGASVVAIEPDQRRRGMYKVVLSLEFASASGQDAAAGNHEASGEVDDWNSEVDAFITGATTAADKTETDTDTEALLTVHEDTLVAWRLLKGRRLTGEEYERLKATERKEEAYRTALGMLERKARTTTELSRALKRKGYEPEAITGCLERLRANRMLDDSAFARRFAEQRAANHRKGRLLIRQELLQRGVGREEAEQALGELDGQVEQEAALALARKRWPQTKGDDRERKMKLMSMLLRRGYPTSIVKSAVQQAAAEAAADEEWLDFDDSVMDMEEPLE